MHPALWDTACTCRKAAWYCTSAFKSSCCARCTTCTAGAAAAVASHGAPADATCITTVPTTVEKHEPSRRTNPHVRHKLWSQGELHQRQHAVHLPHAQELVCRQSSQGGGVGRHGRPNMAATQVPVGRQLWLAPSMAHQKPPGNTRSAGPPPSPSQTRSTASGSLLAAAGSEGAAMAAAAAAAASTARRRMPSEAGMLLLLLP